MTENEIREYIVNECQNTRCKYLEKDNECVEDGNCFKVKTYIIKMLEEIQQYRAIGTVEEFKALKEKNVAKKQGNINDYDSHLRLSKAGFLCCSRTNKAIRYPLISLTDLEHCPCCGQALDWE